MSGVFTIPAGHCFASKLAEKLWEREKSDPLALASYQIFLPTRRACRHLRDAFLRVTETKAALLPRMQPLGDVDEDELDFLGAGTLEDIPPAISPLRRQLLLSELILKKESTLPRDQVLDLAQSLGQLIDMVQTEGLDFVDLENLGGDYAQHWQETLQFLEIITKSWPAILTEEGCLDPAARRALILEKQAEFWRAAPPQGPIIAAGSTGSVRAVGALMHVIRTLPKGEVILPGLDLALDEEAWQAIEETHPQATMKTWLEQGKLSRKNVSPWENLEEENPARVHFLREAMRPPSVSEAWQNLTSEDIPEAATKNMELLTLDHARAEADVIALCLRAALEEEGKTAALVTPDRMLAARVQANLMRWGVEVNDTAGTTLARLPVGHFLITLLKAGQDDPSPVTLLSLLKHPLMADGLPVAACRAYARLAEINVFRGIRRQGGFGSAAHALEKDYPESAQFFIKLHEAFADLRAGQDKKQSLEKHMEGHIALAEKLAATDEEEGRVRLWRGDDGQKAAAWFAEMKESSAGLPEMTGRDYALLFDAFMQKTSVHASFGVHPRLDILGPLEARLLHHDFIILGGLNEGVWPPAPPVDPWMSRPMKKEFGLPSPEKRIGLSSHDFVQLACAPQVVLTRAARAGSAPSVPSRFILQMQTVLKAAGRESGFEAHTPWQDWARALDTPEKIESIKPPAPCPPVSNRPRHLSVTKITSLLRNPYQIYAQYILGLKKLDDIDADVTAAEKGNVIHEALENFMRRAQKGWPEEALDLLLEEGRKAFAPYEDRPQVRAFWWPRFENIARWFVKNEEARQVQGIKPIGIESTGRIRTGIDFELEGRADRIDLLPDGMIEIIDYKTGSAPSAKLVREGIEPQLSLLALIAKEGGFEDLKAYDSARLSYWSLKGKEDEKITSFAGDLDAQIAHARAGLQELIAKFSKKETPYRARPRPRYAPRYDDYELLERVAEWGREEGREES